MARERRRRRNAFLESSNEEKIDLIWCLLTVTRQASWGCDWLMECWEGSISKWNVIDGRGCRSKSRNSRGSSSCFLPLVLDDFWVCGASYPNWMMIVPSWNTKSDQGEHGIKGCFGPFFRKVFVVQGRSFGCGNLPQAQRHAHVFGHMVAVKTILKIYYR